MKQLKELLSGLDVKIYGPETIGISDIVFDSRRVTPGCLFVALRGAKVDGRDFIPAAIKAGARAVVSDQSTAIEGATLVAASDPLAILAPLSLRFWDNPSKKLLMIGITGTNGKTTTSYILESIFNAAGWKIGVMGTINYRFSGKCEPAPNTTPFASEIQRFLAAAANAGGRAVIMEVSSHALALGRIGGVDFDVAVFTNLTQDHLDFHNTLEEYGRAKSLLFEGIDPQSDKPYARRAVLNMDDPWSERIKGVSRVPVTGYRLNRQADVFAKKIESDASGSSFVLQGPRGLSLPVRLRLVGEYNVLNALAAAAAALSQGIDPEAIRKGLETIKGVPGRMERIDTDKPFSVIVDFAHTDDALRNTMAALRRLKPARLLTVFGCGGDRDRTKRPLMGEVAARMSDEVIVTSDNPRSEDPQKITLDVEVGIRRVRSDHYEIIVDREEAIDKALHMARPGDIVLLAGKGHETYQILHDKTVPFDDREVARKLLKNL
jgi:UDP-N-acetylmuramoyl-L-alanyl-D-glutamate--2,6-diaminopimelate ligase